MRRDRAMHDRCRRRCLDQRGFGNNCEAKSARDHLAQGVDIVGHGANLGVGANIGEHGGHDLAVTNRQFVADQGFADQPAQIDRRITLKQGMIGMADQDHFAGRYRGGKQSGGKFIGRKLNRDARIQMLGVQLIVDPARGCSHNAKLDVGEYVCEMRQTARHHQPGHARSHPQREGLEAGSVQAPRCVRETVELKGDPVGFGEEAAPLFGCLHAATRAAEQAKTDLVLEHRNLFADRGLGNVEPLGGPREAAFLRHSQRIANLANFHCHTVQGATCLALCARDLKAVAHEGLLISVMGALRQFADAVSQSANRSCAILGFRAGCNTRRQGNPAGHLMTIRNLDKLFAPGSIAIIGATNRPGAIGNIVTRNVLRGGFEGPVMPVHPRLESVAGVLAYPDVESLPRVPDLAVICTPPEPIPGLIAELGARGTRAAIVLTAGLERVKTADGRTVMQAMLDAARPYLFRILGPNCVGALVPGIGLNASFAHLPALQGRIAFASQSGALCTAVLDWARARDIGFSHFISLGNMADMDFGDVVDYLANDPGTDAILLYIEAVTNGRKFMSACRAAARNKPVVVIKSGTAPEGAAAAATHTGALAGMDRVYDSAFRRAGLLRVPDFDQLFAAVETLARPANFKGERLAILTNGGGIGVLAVDELVRQGGVLAQLSGETIAHLDKVLPSTWSRRNPVDIIGDAPGQRYKDAFRILSQANECDAVLVMHAPVATVEPQEAARAVIDFSRGASVQILTNWVGGETIEPARQLFHEAGVPTYETPGQAVDAFMHMVHYRRNQSMLLEAPAAAPRDFVPDTAVVDRIFARRLDTEVKMLNEPEAKQVLAAYGIPTVEARLAGSAREAAEIGSALGFPVAVKVVSDQIPHKSDVGGVRLSLGSRQDVIDAVTRISARIGEALPEARIDGFSIQKMAELPGAFEVFMGVTEDPIFGPVILFGHGGTAIEVIDDSAVALPPLNMKLARDLIGQTRIAKLLAGYRDRPPAAVDQLCQALLQLSQLVVDRPEIAEIDINPLLVNSETVLALDARIRVQAVTPGQKTRLAIRPYPGDLAEDFILRSGRQVTLRPIRPEDEPAHRAFISSLAADDLSRHFFGPAGMLAHSQLARLTQIDYDREMTFIATAAVPDGAVQTLAAVRAVTDPNNDSCEFAIVVGTEFQGQGLGAALLAKLIAYCRARETRRMAGPVAAGNTAMLKLLQDAGFDVSATSDADQPQAVLNLRG